MALDMQKIQELAERVAGSSGLEVVEIEMRGGGKHRMLRFFIDKPNGVTHEDCADFSREIGTILDVEDAVPGGAYLLEVSSPGLDRRLSKAADYQRFQGSLLKLSTHEPIDGNRHFEGRLEKFDNGCITLDLSQTHRKPKKGHEVPAGKIEIQLANVEKANLVPEI
ncbi:MAG TPA: ribosome maturation factor RimP [Terriglobales bacterium]|nr:ribosome maturation factor RimP [Terriglobales bacterium]